MCEHPLTSGIPIRNESVEGGGTKKQKKILEIYYTPYKNKKKTEKKTLCFI